MSHTFHIVSGCTPVRVGVGFDRYVCGGGEYTTLCA